MTYKWTERAISALYYEAETGKIIGDVTKLSFSDETWHARINGDNLGTYISCATAKKAVEKRTEIIDQETSELNHKVPKGLTDPRSYYEGYDEGVAEERARCATILERWINSISSEPEMEEILKEIQGG